jgi:hypothetical protein
MALHRFKYSPRLLPAQLHRGQGARITMIGADRYGAGHIRRRRALLENDP